MQGKRSGIKVGRKCNGSEIEVAATINFKIGACYQGPDYEEERQGRLEDLNEEEESMESQKSMDYEQFKL